MIRAALLCTFCIVKLRKTCEYVLADPHKQEETSCLPRVTSDREQMVYSVDLRARALLTNAIMSNVFLEVDV